VLRADYIKFARALACPSRAVYFGHALKKPVVPGIRNRLELGALIAFAIITETGSSGPAWLALHFRAVNFDRLPVMAAYCVSIALIFVVINLVVDLLYFAVDAAAARKADRRQLKRDAARRPSELPSKSYRSIAWRISMTAQIDALIASCLLVGFWGGAPCRSVERSDLRVANQGDVPIHEPQH